MADAHVSANAASLSFSMAAVYENWLRTHADTSAVGCGPLEKNWTCPKWHSDQPGAAAAAVVEAVGGAAVGEVPNCYICCYGRPGFGCTPGTPNDTAGSIGDVIPFDKNGYGSFPGSIGWTSASFVIAGILLDAYGSIAALRDLYPGLTAHLNFYNRAAAAHDPRGLGLIYWDQVRCHCLRAPRACPRTHSHSLPPSPHRPPPYRGSMVTGTPLPHPPPAPSLWPMPTTFWTAPPWAPLPWRWGRLRTP
jgi:hypothetical protein